MDLDYVTETKAISGVMTGSGHKEFHWWLTENKDIDFETCQRGHPGCVSLTYSNKNYHTFRNIMLKDGVHYYICAHAHEIVVQRMDFEETIKDVRRCSNGFTVDRTPPVAGHVYAGHRDDGLQRDTTELAVYWSGFSDVDEVSLLKHASGISSYYVAVGSFLGGEDVFGRASVGMTTHYLIQGLSLHSGHTYYAKVIAVDQSGLETVAISNGLTIDATPPTPGSVTVGPFHQSVTYTSCDRIEVQWRDFRDPESSHLNYAVSVGNQPKTSDILPYSAVNGELAVLQGLSIAQGHSYFVNVRATNEVGGVTIVSGGPFMCDQTPPSGGHVSDGSRVDEAGKEQGDIDFQTSTTHLAAHWTGFEEPESSITIYRVAIGTAILADDIQPFTDVSLDTETSHEASLQSGTTYYVTVEACNDHMLCQRVSSDGVTVDDSLPVPGSVVVGYGGSHAHYVHSNQNIRAWWHGFHDPHSDIKSYHWCVGTQSGDSCDVMRFKNVYSLTEGTASQLRLPVNTSLYVTVKAFNNVGLHVQRSSTPFVVDTSPPVFTEPPKFNIEDVSLKEGTQVDRSQMHLKWSAMDQESGILIQTVTIETHQNGGSVLDKMKVGDVNQLSVPLVGEELADGYRYYATVTSCNGAYVCITARSDEVLVDSSGPLIGGLYEPPTFMDTASGSVLNISLQGFSDPHSGVDSYHVRLGLTMGGEELTEGVVTYTSNLSSTVQHCVINLTRPLPDEPMYFSVVVKNGVGLYSKVFHVSFVKRDIYEGTVDIIKHSCPVFSCDGHCTCNTVGATCDHVPYPNTCEEVTTNNSTLVIKDGWSGEDADLTGSAACLRAHWDVLHLKPVRYEYSIGIEGDAVGSGVPGLEIGFWEDVSMTTEAVYCTKKGSRLQHGTTYVFYLRVWLSSTSFAVFQSDGILVDLVAPEKRKRMFIRANIVQPLAGSINNNTLGLQTSWTGIFTDEESHPLTFRFSAGSVPGGGDVIAATDTGTAASFNSTSVVLSPGRRFYVTVTAYNRLGFSSSAYSHDVIVDTDPPHPGIVYVGSPRRHHRWVSETNRLRVCWLGFLDSGSGVRRYEVAIRSKGHNKTYILPWQNVHIKTDVVLRNLSLVTGVTYEAAVAAFDAAGFSTTVMSKTFEVDTTAPCPVLSYEFKKDLVSREPRDWLFTGQSKLQYPYVNITDGKMGLSIKVKANTIHLLQVEAFPPCYRGKSYVKVDTLSTNLDFSESPEGICVFEMTFMSSQNKIIPKNLTITVPEGSLSILGVSLRTSEVTSDKPISESDAIVLRQMSLTDLMVSWFLVDRESGVMTFQVGLGTNPGGFQLAPLTNRGELTYWALRNLRISHRMYVYATVIAINRARLRRAFTSAPYLIDWTPPIVPQPHVRVKPALGIPSYYDAEIEFQGAHDPESHISGCAAALGTSSGSLDVLRWMHVRERNSVTSQRFNYTSGQPVHVTVRCVNRAKLETVVKIDHFVVTDAAPDVTSAQVHLHISSPTSFPARDHVQSYNNTLRVSYSGFKTVTGIDHYLVTLMKGKTVVKSEMNVGLQTDVRLQGLALRDNTTYTVIVRAVNKAGMKSEGVRTNVTVCRASPSIRRENSQVTIKSSPGALQMTWDDVFVRPCSGRLVYQVSAGTRRGSVNLLSPRDTTHAYWEFLRDEPASRSNVHMMVKAVAPSGLYTVLYSAVTVP